MLLMEYPARLFYHEGAGVMAARSVVSGCHAAARVRDASAETLAFAGGG